MPVKAYKVEGIYTMKHVLIICIASLFTGGCVSSAINTQKLLNDYGNTYTYSQISSTSIGLCAPQVSSATVNLKQDKSLRLAGLIVKRDSTNLLRSDEAGSIRSSFFAQLKRQVGIRSLSWNILDDTLNTMITTQLRISDSLRIATIPQDLKLALNNAGIATLIMVYDIHSAHAQNATMVPGQSFMIGTGYNSPKVFSSMPSSLEARIDLDFTYNCAVLDVQNEKVLMFVKMHESSNDPLNFYDQVCESLFNVLLFNGI